MTPTDDIPTPGRAVGQREAEVLAEIGGASRFEWAAAVFHDEGAEPETDSCHYDRRILIVTVRLLLDRLARAEAAVPRTPWHNGYCYACHRLIEAGHDPDCAWLAAKGGRG